MELAADQRQSLGLVQEMDAYHSGENPTHAEVLDLKIVLDAVLGAIAAIAAFLEAAERCDLGLDDAFVDPDHAVFKCLGDAPHPADVAAIK